MMDTLAVMVGDHYHFGVGDPTLVGWLTTLAYTVAFVFTLLSARRAEWRREPGERLSSAAFLWGVTVVILLLGINKQLDLQSWFIAESKELSKALGLYGKKRVIEILFVGLLASAGTSAVVTVGWLIRRHLRRHVVVLAGVFVLVLFVVLRAAAFLKVDLAFGGEIGESICNPILELTGILLVGIGTRYRRPLPTRT